MSVLGWVIMYTLGCPPSQLLAAKDGMGRNPVVRTYKKSWWWLSLGRGTSQGILQKSILLCANPFKDENGGRIKTYTTCQSKMNRFLSPIFFLGFSWPRSRVCLWNLCEFHPKSLGGVGWTPRWQWPFFPVWEHSEVKWWRKKNPRGFPGGTQGVAAWESGMGKWRLKKLCKKDPFFWRPRPQGAFVFFLLVLFVEKKKSDIWYDLDLDMIHLFKGCFETDSLGFHPRIWKKGSNLWWNNKSI